MRHILMLFAALMIFAVSAQPLFAQRGAGSRPGDSTSSDDGATDETDSSEAGEEQSESRPLTFAEVVLKDLAAWRHSQAREKLEADKAERGTTDPYGTPWALLLAEEKKYDEAITKLVTTSKSDTKDPAVFYFLGEIRSWKREREKAKEAWRNARDRAQALVDVDSDDAAARYWLGASLVRLGDFEEAEDQLTTALDGGFDIAMTEHQLGLTMIYQRRWTEARDAFTRCLEAEAAFAHAYYYRGLAWKELGKTEEMLLDMDRFVALAPDAREVSAAQSILRAGG